MESQEFCTFRLGLAPFCRWNGVLCKMNGNSATKPSDECDLQWAWWSEEFSGFWRASTVTARRGHHVKNGCDTVIYRVCSQSVYLWPQNGAQRRALIARLSIFCSDHPSSVHHMLGERESKVVDSLSACSEQSHWLCRFLMSACLHGCAGEETYFSTSLSFGLLHRQPEIIAVANTSGIWHLTSWPYQTNCCVHPTTRCLEAAKQILKEAFLKDTRGNRHFESKEINVASYLFFLLLYLWLLLLLFICIYILAYAGMFRFLHPSSHSHSVWGWPGCAMDAELHSLTADCYQLGRGRQMWLLLAWLGLALLCWPSTQSALARTSSHKSSHWDKHLRQCYNLCFSLQ